VQQLSVVVPTFNERENILVLVPQILDVFRDAQIDGEIIIVDDRSTDGSREVLDRLEQEHTNVRVKHRDPPPSIARAWYDGFDMAEKENIVCIDADLCHDPKYFPEMLETLHDCDLVIGSRYMESWKANMADKSLPAIYASALARFLTGFVTGFKETDTSHSFRLFRKEVFHRVKDHLKSEGNVFLIEFLIHAKRENFRVREISIEYGKRIHGETKLRVLHEGIRYLKFIAKVWNIRWQK